VTRRQDGPLGTRLKSYWIEFGEWPAKVRFRRVPPFPRSAGVTAVDESDALKLIRQGFYQPDRELPPVRQVTPDITVAIRDLSGPSDLREEASGKRGIWYPKPLFPDRTETDEGPRRTPYPVLAHAALEERGIAKRASESTAVVLERIAYGAGSTNWYEIQRPEQFDHLVEVLAPGSSVTFFFDGRISESAVSDATKASILEIVGEDEDAFVARRTDGIELEFDYVAGPDDLTGFLERLQPGERILYGRWGIDDDGEAVMTAYLPDRDGTTRRHPY
jgi:hypothetical protein